MIDPKKVRLMTKLAVYEEGRGRKDLKIHRYNKNTYVNIKQLESMLAVTIAYLFAIVLYCFGIYTEIITAGTKFPFEEYLMDIAAFYIIILLIDWIVTRKYYKREYKEMQENIKKYDHNLYCLKRYIQKEKEDRK